MLATRHAPRAMCQFMNYWVINGGLPSSRLYRGGFDSSFRSALLHEPLGRQPQVGGQTVQRLSQPPYGSSRRHLRAQLDPGQKGSGKPALAYFTQKLCDFQLVGLGAPMKAQNQR